MKAAVVIMWNIAPLLVGWAWLCLLWDKRSAAPIISLGAAAALAVVGYLLDWYFELDLS